MCFKRMVMTWDGHMPDMRRRCAGFTLIEVLVALAVLAIALAALIHGIGVHVSNTAYLRDRTLAHWVAMNKVTEMQLSDAWPGAGTQKGDALMAKQQWYWQAKISETEDADVRRLDMSVYAHEKDQNALSTLVAYLGRPAGTAPGAAPAP